jgi:hypothetical protein
MFLTNERGLQRGFWLNPNEFAWNAVEVMFRQCWFLVDCEIKDSNCSVSSMYLFDRANQILELVTSGILITKVYLISPPYINRLDVWSLHKIIEIRTGYLKNDNNHINIDVYETFEGELFFSKEGKFECNLISDQQIIYSAKLDHK